MYYSQKDPKWRNLSLGGAEMTIGGYGCFLVSMLNISKRIFKINPENLNNLALENKGFAEHGLLYSANVAKLLDMKVVWNGKKLNFPKPDKNNFCIAITDHYRKRGIFQHFVAFLPDGRIIDPLNENPEPRENNYNLISYRHFTGTKSIENSKEIPAKNLSRKDIEEQMEKNSEIYKLAAKSIANNHEILAKTK